MHCSNRKTCIREYFSTCRELKASIYDIRSVLIEHAALSLFYDRIMLQERCTPFRSSSGCEECIFIYFSISVMATKMEPAKCSKTLDCSWKDSKKRWAPATKHQACKLKLLLATRTIILLMCAMISCPQCCHGEKLSDASSAQSSSAMTCIISMIPGSILIPPLIFPSPTLNETAWNSSRARILDNVQHSFGEKLILDGSEKEVKGEALSLRFGSKVPPVMVTRKSINEALVALNMSSQARSLKTSSLPLENFRTSDVSSVENGLLREGEVVGFVSPGALNRGWDSLVSSDGKSAMLQSCQTHYVEHGIFFSEEGGDRTITKEFVNVVTDTITESVSNLLGAKFTEEYKVLLPRAEISESNKRALTKDGATLGYVAVRDLFEIQASEGFSSELIVTANKTLPETGNNFYTFIVLTDNKAKRSREFGSRRVRFRGSEREVLISKRPIRVGEQNLQRREATKSNRSDALLHNRNIASGAAETVVTQLGLAIDANNDIVGLTLALTALLASIVTMASFARSKWSLALKILLELVDLLIGLIPGAVIILRGVSKGHLLISPIYANIEVFPSAMIRENATSATGSVSSDAVYWPSLITECKALGMRRTTDRSFFIPLYFFGMTIGIVALFAQVFVKARKFRSHRRSSRLSAFSVSQAHDLISGNQELGEETQWAD